MKTLKKTLIVVFLSFFFFNLNAQVETILKTSFPELYGNLKITPGKKYDKKDKKAYRQLFYKLSDALGDVEAFKIGAATDQTMQVLDYKQVKQLNRKGTLDSLTAIIKKEQKDITNFMKWHERYGADSLDVGLYYNQFRDNFKQKKYAQAYKNWSILFHNYPLISSSIYSGGSNLLMHFIRTTKDSVLRKAYTDTLFQLYDQQIRVYPKRKAYVRGKEAVDYYILFINKHDLNDSLVRVNLYHNYKMFMHAIDLGGNNTKYYIFPLAMKLTFFEYKLDSLTAAQALDNYLRFSDILSKQYSKETDPKKKARIKQQGIDYVDMIFSKSDLSTCENLCPTFQKKYERDSTNVDNLKRIITILGQKGCTDCQLYSDIAVTLNKLKPSCTSAHAVALLFASKQKYTEALNYIDQAIKLDSVDSTKANYYFEGAQMYNKMKSYAKAREYARKAIELKPNFGNAYILIATMYASTANSIGKDQFSHNAVFWAAADKLIEAKRVDPSVAKDADKLLNTYSGHFPGKENGFMHNVLKGASYTVGGWIGETTTARYLK